MENTRINKSLAGNWRFALDPDNKGIKERWFARTLEQTITLPGTTDEAGFGELTNEACEDRLSRTYRWIGPAWYQTTVNIEQAWADKKTFLFLERTKDSQVWVDETWIGSEDSLSASHRFDLTKALAPGEHTITVLIDNAKLPPVGPCHQVDERTQTNWNGILGRIELQVHEKMFIASLNAYPDLTPANCPNPNDDEPIDLGLAEGQTTIEVVAELVNESPWSGKGGFTFTAEVIGRESDFDVPPIETGTLVKHGRQQVKARFILPADIPQWDEFNPTCLRITMEAEAMPRTEWVRDRLSIVCGLRSFAADRGQFVINGRPTFLRGKNDCALFPITGYAPMDKAFWLKFLGVGRDYGINHYRFHSWCPPGAAFEAADELGIYFQVELPNKRGITEPENADYSPPAEAYETLDELVGDAGDPAERTRYLTAEGEKILRQYGNHPSFVMMTLGNEIGGDEHVMKAMTDHFRKLDRRHLYALGTNAWHWDIRHREGNDFWVIKGTSKGDHIRGASWDSLGHIDNDPPSTTKTYSSSLRGVPVPLVAHEMAQFEVYPDYTEIEKYTGVLKPKNLEIFRERLDKAGMLDQAKDFQQASGLLSLVCRKEDVESEIRTPGMAGFQLLDIQDFSGQGTALIGILDVFMDSKGLTTSEKWREFCCETVPLFIMPKYTWVNDEKFRGRIQVAHYGPADLTNKQVNWSLGSDKATIADGSVTVEAIPTGDVTEVDVICSSLESIDTAQKLTLEIALPGTPYRNSYDVWVYPAEIDTTEPADVLVTRQWDDRARRKLADGGRVLLMPNRGELKDTVAMSFQSGFWSPMFRMKGRPNPATGGETPGTQGLLLDPEHPLFDDFPTEFHSNWQWWHFCKNCDPMILDDTPHDYRPTVQVIDGIDRNHKLGLILEAKVGQGKLLICTIDLPAIQEHPEARQFLSGLYRYVSSDALDPKYELDVDTLETIV
jgi:hypothetical protein